MAGKISIIASLFPALLRQAESTSEKLKSLSLMLPVMLLAGCVSNGTPDSITITSEAPKIDKVFFAQQHVLEPNSPLFKLVGDLNTLIKVQVYSERPTPSPLVLAKLELDSKTMELPLLGPRMLPKPPTCDPALMEHSYDDSFTAMIPREWVRPGLKVKVELKEYNYDGVDDDDKIHTNCSAKNYITVADKKVFNDLKIGAPSKVVMQMFDIHYFGRGKGADYPDGWEAELEAKLPVSELIIHRVKDIMFNEIVTQPVMGKPSARYTSLEDFKKKTGKDYDGEQRLALYWCAALKAAGGRFGLWRPYHVNIAGVYSGGQAGGYRSCANLHKHGVIIHELGHTFGLPHWNFSRHLPYPYKRTMYGEDKGEETGANAGPTWAFDVSRREFLPPRKMVNGKLDWRKDPMQGGGRSGDKTYLFKHFSDFSINRIQKRLENGAAYWNEKIGKYAKWNQETGAYDKVIENNGLIFPIERDVDVISLLASANIVAPDANIIYPPIGPYKGGLIRRFDADSAEDRKDAEKLGYTEKNCNVSLRVTQGGKVKSYLMTAKVSPDDDPMKAFNASAINLPARDGEVTKAELLYCPDLIKKGITPKSKLLYTWERARRKLKNN